MNKEELAKDVLSHALRYYTTHRTELNKYFQIKEIELGELEELISKDIKSIISKYLSDINEVINDQFVKSLLCEEPNLLDNMTHIIRLLKTEEDNVCVIGGKICSNIHPLKNGFAYWFEISNKRKSGVEDIIAVIVPKEVKDRIVLKKGLSITVYGTYRRYGFSDNTKSACRVLARRVYTNNLYDINSIVISGTICKPPNYRMTSFCKSLCDIWIMTKRDSRNNDKINCIAWGKLAEILSSWRIHSKVILHGKILSRSYKKVENGNLVNKRTTEISIFTIYKT